MKLDYWSPTRHRMLYRCGEQFRRRYLEREILPPGIAMVRGRAQHAAQEAGYRRRIEGGAPLSPVEAEDLAAEAFDREARMSTWVLGGQYETLGLSRRAALGHAKDDAVHLAALYAERIAPTVEEPAYVEQRVEIPASEALPVPLVLVFDVVDKARRIPRDTKTSAGPPKKGDVEQSEQLSAQALAYRALTGEVESAVGIDWLWRTPKTRDQNAVPLTDTRSTEDLAVFVRRAKAAIRQVEAEVFLPAPADSWVCTRRWCGYFDTCPYAARGRARPTT